ncbi:aminotransferase class IV [Lutibacter citreus]|uniref:aminotransferase class IV n=1 Tax=Lutibacter citreus TaxID=2138210 RepID=UPI000DBE2BE6|nr:aminotransferase class IV [Lutibacter citreus]
MINLNGTILSDTKKIFDSKNRAFKYGDALFETIKVENRKVVFLEDHYFRLMASMRMLRMDIPMSLTLEFFEKEILKTVESNELIDARVRVAVYRKDGGFYLPISNKVNFVVEASELTINRREEYKIDLYKDYYVYSGLLSTVKTTNRITNVLASIFAEENELDNCILLNERKYIVEVINGNIFIIKGNVIKTPSISEGCVKGIVRKKLIEIIENDKVYSIEETPISSFELQKADEVFITNAIIGIQPVTSYRKSNFKTDITKELIEKLTKLV